MTILQYRILDIYKEFKRICDKYELRYYATGGTAIGAVRHRGFIPWDDDLDIDMPAPDYAKFIEVAKKELQGSLELFNGLDHRSDYVFAKIHDTSTMLTTSMLINTPESYTGVFIDIFPMAGMPNDRSVRERFELEQILYIRQLFAENILPDDNLDRKTKGKSARVKNIKEKYIESLTKYNFDSSVHIRRAGSTLLEQSRFLGRWYEDYVEFPFEDTTMRLPREYDEMLKSRFGDYMTLPIESDRHAVHEDGGVVDLENSLERYRAIITGEGDIDKELSVAFSRSLARLANYEMMRHVHGYWEIQRLQVELGDANKEVERLLEGVKELRAENEALSRRINELRGIKKSVRLVVGNMKRRMQRKG